MNKELIRLLEICKELHHRVIEFGYSEFHECYMATVEVNELGDSYKTLYQDEKWSIE